MLLRDGQSGRNSETGVRTCAMMRDGEIGLRYATLIKRVGNGGVVTSVATAFDDALYHHRNN